MFKMKDITLFVKEKEKKHHRILFILKFRIISISTHLFTTLHFPLF
jgi:hypothetical protein